MDLSTKTVHVGNLSSEITTEVLREIFGCLGQINDIRLSSDGRYGFVDFAEASVATASLELDGTPVCGQSLRVQRATHQRMFSNQANPPPAPMLSQLQGDHSTAMASVTSKAALEALQKTRHNAQNAAPDANIAFMNPAQQRAALEAKHREMVAKNSGGWGVAKRREETSSDESSADSRRGGRRHTNRRRHYRDDRRRDHRRYDNYRRYHDDYHKRRGERSRRSASRSNSPPSSSHHSRGDYGREKQQQNNVDADDYAATSRTSNVDDAR